MPYKDPEKRRARGRRQSAQINAARRQTKLEIARLEIETNKRKCCECGISKPLVDFGSNPRRLDGKSIKCLECKRLMRVRASQRFRDRHPERITAYSRTYSKTHRGVLLVRWKQASARRKALLYELPYTFTQQEYDFMMHYWGYACAICGNQDGFQWKLSLDHWIAITNPESPGTVATNILPLCHGKGGCNNSKNDTDGFAWLKRRYGARKATVILHKIQQYFALVSRQGCASSA